MLDVPAEAPRMTITLQLGAQSITLDARNPRVMIGRDTTSCNLVGPDASVSRRHAEVALDAGGQARLRDYGSSNGTWMDGRALAPGVPIAIAPQQQIFVGHMPLVVSWSQGGATVMGQASAQMLAMMDAHRAQQQAAAQSAAPAHAPGSMGAVGATIGVGGK